MQVAKYQYFLSDVVTIEKTGEHFRLIYDVKGRFAIHRITAEEAKVGDIFSVVVFAFNKQCDALNFCNVMKQFGTKR